MGQIDECWQLKLSCRLKRWMREELDLILR